MQHKDLHDAFATPCDEAGLVGMEAKKMAPGTLCPADVLVQGIENRVLIFQWRILRNHL